MAGFPVFHLAALAVACSALNQAPGPSAVAPYLLPWGIDTRTGSPGPWSAINGQLAGCSCAPGAWSIGLNCRSIPREPAPGRGRFRLIALIACSWPQLLQLLPWSVGRVSGALVPGPLAMASWPRCLRPGPRAGGRVPAAIMEMRMIIIRESCARARALAAQALARFHTNNHH